MTTKRWLLDLLDKLDAENDAAFPATKRVGTGYAKYCDRKADIEKARRLVQQGADEPC